MGVPSNKAAEAAVQKIGPFTAAPPSRGAWEGQTRIAAQQALDAAHDPGLGLDRSVCLRDVVDTLDELHEDSTLQSRAIARAVRLLIQRYAEET